MVSYRYMNMGMQGLRSGTSTVNPDSVFADYLMSSDKMRMDMHMLMGMYGITDKLTAMVMLHYNVVSMDMAMFDAAVHNHPGMGAGTGATHTMNTAGLGDIKLHALYAVVKKPRYQVVVSAGINIPSGSIQNKGGGDEMMYANERLPYSMQLGSGTTDILPGINYLYQGTKFTFSTQVTSVIRTGYNSVGYNLGNEFSSNSWLAYQWFPFLSSSLRVEGIAADKIAGFDPTMYYYSEPSANPYNYGGSRLNGYMGVVFQPKKGILKSQRLGAEFGMPLYQNLNGIQMSYKQTINLSWAFIF